MKVLLTASELAPFARTGGLGDVLEALPPALAARGHEVTMALPCYRGLRDDSRLGATATGVTIPIQIGDRQHAAEILQATAPNGTQVFLIRRDEYFDREGLYGADGRDFGDNADVSSGFQKRSWNWRAGSHRCRKSFMCTIGRRRWCRC
jgi:starch synthase